MKQFITYILLLIALLIALNLSAVNQMELMQTFTNNIPNSCFGNKMAALDFNNDGYDDLAVFSYSNSTFDFGHIYLYFGSAVPDTVPDLVYTAPIEMPYCSFQLIKAGDVNGDSIDDMLVMDNLANDAPYCTLRFYYGGENPDLVQDYEMQFQNSVFYDLGAYPIECLGDINNDGYDDIGLSCANLAGVHSLKILLGGSFASVTVIDSVSTRQDNLVTRIGDMNGDGIDDFMVGYAPSAPWPEPEFPRYRYIYYGGNPLDITNRVLLMESYEENQIGNYGNGIGDFNGDGYDDCIYYYLPPNAMGNKVFKMGSATLPVSGEFYLTEPDNVDLTVERVSYGDFNADGYSDLAGGSPTSVSWYGVGGIWFGMDYPNGTMDYQPEPPEGDWYFQFGWIVETGDFNGDGYCDAAYSAPRHYTGAMEWYPGKVYVYAGNGQLRDTTVGNDDNVCEPVPQLRLQIYPNPVSGNKTKVHFRIEGDIKNPGQEAEICLYNIKGQLVTRHRLSSDSIKNGTGVLFQGKLKKGTYIAALNAKQTRLATAKITIK